MKVRLKPAGPPCHSSQTQFQFHEGPIKTSPYADRINLAMKFQFHEGPIKTSDSINAFGANVVFQFHEGPIKTVCQNSPSFLFTCFNSMKVRLKRPASLFAVLLARFQFHEGPIKTEMEDNKTNAQVRFNSMKVRLKPRKNSCGS